MAYNDLQEYLLRLETSRELYRYSKRVASIHAANTLAAKHKKALLFESIEGAAWPVVMNLLGNERRVAWALGVDNLQTLSERAARLFDVPMPLKFGDVMARAGDVMGLLRTPAPVSNGKIPPCQEVIRYQFDLTTVPHRLFEGKAIISDAVLIVEQGDRRFVKTVDAEIVDAQHLWMGQIDGFKSGEPSAAALVFGDDPSWTWAASFRLPRYVTPFMIAGWLRGRPLTLVRGVTQSVAVPARAEIVIEGTVDAQANGLLFTLGAVTHRAEAVFPLGEQSVWADEAAERLLLPAVRLVVDGLHDLHLGSQYIIASLKRDCVTIPTQAVMMLWALEMTAFAHLIVIVDEGVDVRDLVSVRAALQTRCHPQHDVFYIETGQGRLKLGAIALSSMREPGAESTAPFEDVMRLLLDGASIDVLGTD